MTHRTPPEPVELQLYPDELAIIQRALKTYRAKSEEAKNLKGVAADAIQAAMNKTPLSP